MKKCVFIVLLLSTLISTRSAAQEIDFGSFFAYSVTVAELSPGAELDFGFVLANTPSSIGISNSIVVSITGVKYLDVIIDVDATDLYLNGNSGCDGNPSCSIPFTLNVSFANRGLDNISQAEPATPTSALRSIAQFPILKRSSGPAGPPPTPVYNGFDPSIFNETAYLYLYGDINPGNITAGSYSSFITVMVNYD